MSSPVPPLKLTTQYGITVDTEEEWDWNSGYPTSTPSLRNILELPRLQEACERLGVCVTYFVNHAVLADGQAADVISQLAERPGVEIGLHIHPWNTPPLSSKANVAVRESFLHNLPQDEALAKLQSVFDIFQQCDLQPTSFRGGRYSTSDWIQRELSTHGVLADASIVPYTTWSDDGAPDYCDRGLAPIRREYQCKPLWEIPLTMGYTRAGWKLWRKFYSAAEAQLLRPFRLVGIAERLFVNRVWLNLEHPLGEHVNRLLPVLRQMQLPFITFSMHSSSLLPGTNPYIRNQSDLEGLFSRLESAMSLIAQWPEFEPATITSIARRLETSHAHPGN